MSDYFGWDPQLPARLRRYHYMRGDAQKAGADKLEGEAVLQTSGLSEVHLDSVWKVDGGWRTQRPYPGSRGGATDGFRDSP